jgi:hypothetical protein
MELYLQVSVRLHGERIYECAFSKKTLCPVQDEDPFTWIVKTEMWIMELYL